MKWNVKSAAIFLSVFPTREKCMEIYENVLKIVIMETPLYSMYSYKTPCVPHDPKIPCKITNIPKFRSHSSGLGTRSHDNSIKLCFRKLI